MKKTHNLQQYAYADGWKVNKAETLPFCYEGSPDVYTMQTAPSGLKYVVHIAPFCTGVIPCDENGDIPETVLQRFEEDED